MIDGLTLTPRVKVEGNFYVNESLEKLMFEELRNACRGGGELSTVTLAHAPARALTAAVYKLQLDTRSKTVHVDLIDKLQLIP